MEDAISRCCPIGLTSVVVAVWIMRRNVRVGLELVEETLTMMQAAINPGVQHIVDRLLTYSSSVRFDI